MVSCLYLFFGIVHAACPHVHSFRGQNSSMKRQMSRSSSVTSLMTFFNPHLQRSRHCGSQKMTGNSQFCGVCEFTVRDIKTKSVFTSKLRSFSLLSLEVVQVLTANKGVQLKYAACSIWLLSFCGMLIRLPTCSSHHWAKKGDKGNGAGPVKSTHFQLPQKQHFSSQDKNISTTLSCFENFWGCIPPPPPPPPKLPLPTLGICFSCL